MNKETRNTLIIAGIIIFVFIAPAFGIISSGLGLKLAGGLGAFQGFIHGFNWVKNRRKQKKGDLDE